MPILLDGGCRVTSMREGQLVAHGTLDIWNQIGIDTGAQAISLRTLEFAPGISEVITNEKSDEVLYLLEGSVTLSIDEREFEVEADSGIYLRPGQTLRVNNPGSGPVVMISCCCPDPAAGADLPAQLNSDTAKSNQSPIVSLRDRKAIPTADRWYRVLVDDEVGSAQVTQFVGSIPPGRAPDHFHQYEEVLFILNGAGRMWAGETNTAIGPGSCIYLPKGQVHCVENIGDGELRLLGVFYPAGSPSVRYEA